MVKLTTKIASLKLFASYAIATYILVMLTSALNLFKGYVADTFYIAETLLIILTIILIIILTTEQTWKHHDLWRRIVEVLLLLMTLTGNVFTLLMFVSIRRVTNVHRKYIVITGGNRLYEKLLDIVLRLSGYLF